MQRSDLDVEGDWLGSYRETVLLRRVQTVAYFKGEFRLGAV